MTKIQSKERRADAKLAAQQQGHHALLRKLTKKLAERILDAEMDLHLAQSEERSSGNMRNT